MHLCMRVCACVCVCARACVREECIHRLYVHVGMCRVHSCVCTTYTTYGQMTFKKIKKEKENKKISLVLGTTA